MSAARCLYCDKPLVFKCDTKWQKNPVPPCPDCGGEQHVQGASYYRGVGEGERKLYCNACDALHDLPKGWKERTVASRERYRDKPGPYGDGFFCSLTCGYRFGVAAAKAGYRLVKKGA